MASYLHSRLSSYVFLYFFPAPPIKPQSLDEASVLLIRPPFPRLSQCVALARLHGTCEVSCEMSNAPTILDEWPCALGDRLTQPWAAPCPAFQLLALRCLPPWAPYRPVQDCVAASLMLC